MCDFASRQDTIFSHISSLFSSSLSLQVWIAKCVYVGVGVGVDDVGVGIGVGVSVCVCAPTTTATTADRSALEFAFFPNFSLMCP